MCRGFRDEALDEQGVVAEAAAGLAAGARDGLGQLGRLVHLAHALAAAARARLEQHRVADLLDGQRERRVVEARPVRAGHHGHARLRHRLLRADLVAHRLDRRRRRPDEHDPRLLAGGGERGVLGEEAVAGVHGLRAGGPGRVDHGRDREVALDPDGDVGEAHVRCLGVGVGEDGDRADPHAPQRLDHAAGDLAAVGDEHGVKHGHLRGGQARCGVGWGHRAHIRKTPKAGSPSGAFAAADRARPSTVRVSFGSITPSSQSRAVE